MSSFFISPPFLGQAGRPHPGATPQTSAGRRFAHHGGAAVNQAVKAVATARGYLEPDGIDTACVPSFT
ncbi:MAG TPA: hypothetical protein EYH30_03600, partial [Anaerolineales bacterium]|nr:hypothetical protein [Anaerolineales bacterium]